MLTERLRNLGGDKSKFYREILLTVISGILIIIALLLEFVFHSPIIIIAFISILSLLFTGIPIIINCIKGLINRETNVDELVSIALIALIILNEFITAAMVGFIMTLGAIIEEFTAGKARSDIEAIIDKNPTHALVFRESQFVEEQLENVIKGDRVLITPGDVIPVDGIVLKGKSSVDEANLTGESILKEKFENDYVYTGTINHEGALEIMVEKIGEDTTYGKIVSLIKEAENQRIPTRRVVDIFVKWYTPIILILAFMSWLITMNIYIAVSILVVSCPCALVLSTPVSIISGLACASHKGVLIKKGEYLEACADINYVAFDKTGTLTCGQPKVKSITSFNTMTPREILALAARAEASSEHPIAKAILSRAQAEDIDIDYKGQLQSYRGLGIEATSENGSIILGSRRFFNQLGFTIPSRNYIDQYSDNFGQTSLFISLNKEVIGMILIEDDIRNESSNVVKSLRKLGIENVVMLTGDSEVVARHVANICEILPDSINFELLPDQKLEHIQRIQNYGWNVCYIGDGVNDGPALAKANLGISIGSKKNTVALETSDIVLMRENLELVPFILELGRKTKKTITMNLVFAIIYGIFMLVLAFLGIINPFLGAVAHNLGSLIVISNSIRLTRFKGSINNIKKI
jgi:Cd2+/Zn2+-exporting ATPase